MRMPGTLSIFILNLFVHFPIRYHLIVRHYLMANDFNNLIKCCKRLGANQPSLWLQALTGLCDNKLAPVNLLTQVLQVIGEIEFESFDLILFIFHFCIS